MRHPLPAVALAATTALLLTACAGGAGGTDDATPGATAAGGVTLVSPGTLTVCTNPPYEPFEFEGEDGQIEGLDIDIVREVAEDLGVELATKVTPFETIQSGTDLETGTCDVVASGITITEERAAKFDFSQPYFDADQGILVPAGSAIATADDLTDARVGVQQATTGETWAQEEGIAGLVQFEDLGLQVQALETGQVDAIVNDIAVLGPFVEDGFEVAATIPTGEQYGLGVKKGNAALLAAIDGTLERIVEDGTYDEIYTARIGTAPAGD
ncbi:transporter substrate-binding domain-containing protein [Cellulomonas oligotrophica]|uniref:Basic amino acid ABC transporter substrate-binding protein n=1 Tax=Cellulomonas oligotrophica TaxID=931536 RepID=A0A7Y9FL00_9CELL|nr:transporter substrate-binding domain-containing protein [Cellulomonas oligotrophica]NYD88021.1 polar amino acid transport system substrate-binding protein [Cellulomonas oligotrophica]GIG33529.1 basic amino acid ABC transporter substrate-binding protein [Cellulomonas oligotrophica]